MPQRIMIGSDERVSRKGISVPIVEIRLLLLLCCLICHGCGEDSLPDPGAEISSGSAVADAAPSQARDVLQGLPENWEPREPLREWKYIILHHSATETGNVESIDAVHRRRRDSKGQPWLGIGYHFVIGNGHGMPDGAIEPTFRWEEQTHGAHAGTAIHNQWGIGVCLVGHFDRHPPTQAQLQSVQRLISLLRLEFGIDENRVLGHSTIRPTACPGKLFHLDDVLSESSALQSLRRTTIASD